MASPVNEASSAGVIQKNSPTQAESDNSARSRTVMAMLSGFANECMTEWGFYPGMAQDMEALKVENAALRTENTTLRTEGAALKQNHALMQADIEKLWQDNEVLDRTLKNLGPERDFFKDRAERYHVLLAQSPENLPAVCHNLQQEVERLRRQHAALLSTTERLVNDGLAIGVLVKSEPSSDDSSLNVHYKRLQIDTTQARVSLSNIPQQGNGISTIQAHQMSPVHQQQPVFIRSQTQQPSSISTIHRQSTSSVHIPSQITSQPQFVAHRIPNNRPEAMSPVDQRRHSVSSISPFVHERPVAGPLNPVQLLQSQYNVNAHIHPQAGICAPSHSQLPSRSQPSSSPFTTSLHSSRITIPSQRSASSPHPLSPYPLSQVMMSQSQSASLETSSSRSSIVQSHPALHSSQHLQGHMIPPSRSAPLEHQSSRSTIPQCHSVPPNGQPPQVQMIPQSSSAPPENQSLRSSIPQNHSPPTKSQASSSTPNTPTASISPVSINSYPQSATVMGPPSAVVHSTPAISRSFNGLPVSVPVCELQMVDKKPIQGPAPPTPPRSEKSLSPEQEHYTTLPSPILIREPLKRASMDEGVPASSSKRMRLDTGDVMSAPVQSIMPASPATVVPQSTEPMARDVTKDLTVPNPQPAGEPAKARTLDPTEKDEVTTVQAETTSILLPLVPAVPYVEIMRDNAPLEAHNSTPIAGPSGSAIPAVGRNQDVDDAESEEGDEELSEKEALEEVLKSEHSKNICNLCRARRDRYPDKYTDAIFDPDTPTSVLVGHFITTHPAVWKELRPSDLAAAPANTAS
ncbi:hypothetical protein J3R30DRAFT_2742099 [Lentinula aciculospora]|uniref:Uncharacterized protein n=1 Tax=Lentinula aciculospora TaxID=153920 RepID=A0A9W8ZXI8_9AGAR|nr:hypothetical protein J3R30DRAFT_3713514 [Lentinula aciculospora]KAJ4479287.1 hypothetical protein J3R30DRAFT_2742099 [Lentinula aciculospora]